GYNTDVIGFEASFKEKYNPLIHRKALILGTGGASAAVQYILTKLQIPFKLVSRKLVKNGIKYEQLNESIYADYTIIINTTPLGTFPTIHEAPRINYNCINENFYLYDLVYNPEQTLFLKLGEQKKATIKNGYDMLTLQAEESWRIWNE
ncbi:MAG: shikimate dehydrogenase, partial [Sediminibacterium sp.]|nr:shikimate dehydrogenase [Sediminibacterium sp.]